LYSHPRVYMRVQGTMASVIGGPVYKPDRGSLPRACKIGLRPHVAGYSRLPEAVRRPGGARFEDTTVRILPQLRSDMSEEAQTSGGPPPPPPPRGRGPKRAATTPQNAPGRVGILRLSQKWRAGS
jgi:hypothetical protein